MREIDLLPIGRDANKPGGAEWRISSSPALQGLPEHLSSKTDLYQATITLSGPGINHEATVFCDDKKALKNLEEYFKANSVNVGQVVGVSVGEAIPNITYIIGNGLKIEDERIGELGLPYEGIHDINGKNFVAVGKSSVGTFKSLVIGALSGIQANQKDDLPVHSSILVNPDGQAVAISGRGNTGKTTTLLMLQEHLLRRGYKVITDDWAFIGESDRKISPVDFLAGIREESFPGLLGEQPTKAMLAVIEKLKTSLKEGGGIPLSVFDIFGLENTSLTGTLRAVIFTSVVPRPNEILFEPIGTSDQMGARLRSDAYHSPTIPRKIGEDDLPSRYCNLVKELKCSYLYTRAQNKDRLKQAEMVLKWMDQIGV